MATSRAFLEIDIGDATAYSEQLGKYTRACEYLAAVGTSQLGLPSSVSDLDEDQKALLLESYSADPVWSKKGEASVDAPAPIRAGRLVVELYEADVGEKGLGKASKKPLHYRGGRFHRIVTNFCCQGGDIVRGDGSGGDSIYNGSFNDEKKGLSLKHDAAGVLSMANSGKNTNTSQFFFTLAPAPQCDGKHTVFGRVLEGLDILERINKEVATADGTPRTDVTIAECGLLS